MKGELRCSSFNIELPDPRDVSLSLQEVEDHVEFNNERTRLMADFGQFVTHDIIQTPDLAGPGPDPCDCRRTDVCVNIKAKKRKDPMITMIPCFFIVKSTSSLVMQGWDTK